MNEEKTVALSKPVNTYKYPSQQEIAKKLAVFKEKFTDHFMKRLNIIGSQAKELLPPKEGEKSEKVVSGMSWVREGVASVPVVGGFVSLGLKAPEELIKKKLADHQKVKAERVHETVQGMGDEWVKEIVHFTAQELIRIYEYQIGMLADEANVTKFAEAAVDIAIDYFSKEKHQNKEFNIHTLLVSVMSGEKIPSNTTKVINTVTTTLKKKAKDKSNILQTCISDVDWRIPSIFTKPGIRKKTAAKNKFECFNFEGSKPEKYGYRGQIKEPDEEGGYIDFRDKIKTQSSKEIDENKKALYEFHQKYNGRTIYVLADKNDLNKYREYLKEFNEERQESEAEEKPKNFNQFLSEKYGRKTAALSVKAVYRDTSLTEKTDFSGSDFSETDFSGIKIENFKAQNGNFENCIFTHTQFINVDFKEANLKHAQMNFSQFKGNTSLQGVNVNYADFSFTEADKEINFSEVTDFKGTYFKFSNFYTIENDKTNASREKATLRFIAVEEGADISQFQGKLIQIGIDTKIAQGSTEQDVDNLNRVHDNSIASLKKDGGTTFIGFTSKSKPTGSSTIEQIASRGEVTANPYLQTSNIPQPRQSELTSKHGIFSEEQNKRKDSHHARTKVYILDAELRRSTVNDDEFTVTLEKNGGLTICWSHHGQTHHKSLTQKEAAAITQQLQSLGLNAGKESQNSSLIRKIELICGLMQRDTAKEEDVEEENQTENVNGEIIHSKKH